MPLTELQIKHLKPKTKIYRVTDRNGLCLEVTPAGGKHWRWRYRFHHKAQMASLGSYPIVSLAEARRKREEYQRILESGQHPTRVKKAQKRQEAYSNDNTFERIAIEWLDIKKDQLNAKYHKQCLARMKQHVFPVIGSVPIADITIPDVVYVIENIGDDGTIETAKRMKQQISQVFRYAAQKGLCTHNPAADLRNILPSKKENHHTCIPMEELPELIRAIKAYRGNVLTQHALTLMALTFVRTSELIKAKWEEIDWKRKEWYIPAERMKMKRPHLVPLSIQAIDTLKELQSITGKRDYIFYSPQSKYKHISNNAILSALKHIGYKGRMTGHGFRSLASTILNEKGYDPDVIERQLAHDHSDKVRAAYNRAQYLPQRKRLMQDYADLLDQASTTPKGYNILSFQRNAESIQSSI